MEGKNYEEISNLILETLEMINSIDCEKKGDE